MSVWCESWLILFLSLLSLKNLTAHIVRVVLGVICSESECIFMLVICGNHLLLVVIDEFSLGVSFYIGIFFLPFFHFRLKAWQFGFRSRAVAWRWQQRRFLGVFFVACSLGQLFVWLGCGLGVWFELCTSVFVGLLSFIIFFISLSRSRLIESDAQDGRHLAFVVCV